MINKIIYFLFCILCFYGCQLRNPVSIQTDLLLCEKDTIVGDCIVRSQLDSAYQTPQLVDSILFFNELKLILKQNKLTSLSEYFVYATFEIDEIGNSAQYFLPAEKDTLLPILSSEFQAFLYKTKWHAAKYHNKCIRSNVGISFNLKKNGICSFEFQSDTYPRLIFRIDSIPFD